MLSPTRVKTYQRGLLPFGHFANCDGGTPLVAECARKCQHFLIHPASASRISGSNVVKTAREMAFTYAARNSAKNRLPLL